uniref:Merozoite surface protein 2 n=1 Tax=Hymenolepis diminuta TaxID=6216 RepID=A0A0R3SNE2_HYMDI
LEGSGSGGNTGGSGSDGDNGGGGSDGSNGDESLPPITTSKSTSPFQNGALLISSLFIDFLFHF